MEINKLIVHGGVFHADDVMCAAIAKEINPNVEILRVRSVPETVEEGTVVADIGGGKYDHHQKDAEVRENGEKYAACGLLLRDCWQDMFPNEEGYKQFEQNVIIPIERADNGLEKNPLSLAVSSFVPNWDSEESMDEAFDKATDFMKGFLDRTIETERSKERAEDIVENCLNEMYKTGRDSVILSKFAPWQSVLVPSDANYVIYPGARGGYNLQCVPKEMGSFETKRPLPDKWLEEKPEGCTFVHNNKFLAVFDSLEDALNAVNNLEKEQYLTIYKQIARDALISWNSMDEQTATEYVKERDNSELEKEVYAEGSIDAVLQGLQKYSETRYGNDEPLTDKEVAEIKQVIMEGNSETRDTDEIKTNLREKIDPLYTELNTNQKYNMVLSVLEETHDTWVKENEKKFFLRDKKYQHMPMELIGFKEVKSDLLFAKPILEGMGLIDLTNKEKELETAYEEKQQSFLKEHNITDEESLARCIVKGDDFYPALRGQDTIIDSLAGGGYSKDIHNVIRGIEENTNIMEKMAEYNKTSEDVSVSHSNTYNNTKATENSNDTQASDIGNSNDTQKSEPESNKKEYAYLVKEEIDEPDPEDSYYRRTGSHYIGAFKTIEAAEKRESSLFMEEFRKDQEDKKYMEETFPSWKEDLLKDNPEYKDYSNDELKEKYKKELDEYKVSKYYHIEVIPMVSYDVKWHGEFLDDKEVEVDEEDLEL